MRELFIALLALAAAATPPAQSTRAGAMEIQIGPDLSGRWNRDSVGGADAAGWGPRVDIAQSGVVITVLPSPGKPSRFRLDGKETAEALSIDGCSNTVRITKAVASRDHVTITTWIVNKPTCVHGEDEDDPLISQLGIVDVEKVVGWRKLESITAVYREANVLTIETTRSALGGEVATTTATYRK